MSQFIQYTRDSRGHLRQQESKDMETGIVVTLVKDKGFGFIRNDKGAQFFFHKSMLSEGLAWSAVEVGHNVQFVSRQGKKGMEATAVTPVESKRKFSSIDDIPGDYGMVSIVRGNYTNADKRLEECDGIAFCGLGTFGGRFPNNHKLISRLRDMRAVFDKEHKFWFLQAAYVPSNLDRIEDLVKVSRHEKRMETIGKAVIGMLGLIAAITIGAILIVVAVPLFALMMLGGGRGGSPFRTKISRTGNVWVGNNRIT